MSNIAEKFGQDVVNQITQIFDFGQNIRKNRKKESNSIFKFVGADSNKPTYIVMYNQITDFIIID